MAHNGQIMVEDQMLNGLLGAAQVYGGLLHVQQRGLHIAGGEASELRLKESGYLPGQGLSQ
jgi:hypothetical protein